MLCRQLFRLSVLFASLLPIAFAQTTPPKLRTVWDGVYNSTQENRGATTYAWNCSRCHGEDLRGARGVLHGAKFLEDWREDTLNSLFTIMKQTMPPGPRGTVTDAEYIDIIAYLLGANEFPAGAAELSPADLARTWVVGKQGPAPVPDSALVTIVGCLTQPAPGRWTLTSAGEPARTRNPRESAEPEVSAAAARPRGTRTFGLLDTINFPRELEAGRWMEAKGFLIRAPGDDRINLTWLHTLRNTCESPTGN